MSALIFYIIIIIIIIRKNVKEIAFYDVFYPFYFSLV